jgi:hypothetical protein
MVGNRPRERLQHERAPLVVRHREAHQVPRVIVQERRDIYPLLAPKQEREQIRLPQLVRLGPLKATPLRLRPRLHTCGRAQPLLPQHPAHRRLRRPNAEEAPHHVPNPPAPRLRLDALHFQHRLAPWVRRRPRRPRGWANRPRCQRGPSAHPILPRPLAERRVRYPELLRHPRHWQLLIDHHCSSRHHHVKRPRPSRRMCRTVLHLRPSLIQLRLHLFTPLGLGVFPDRRTSARWFLHHPNAHLLVRGTPRKSGRRKVDVGCEKPLGEHRTPPLLNPRRSMRLVLDSC